MSSGTTTIEYSIEQLEAMRRAEEQRQREEDASRIESGRKETALSRIRELERQLGLSTTSQPKPTSVNMDSALAEILRYESSLRSRLLMQGSPAKMPEVRGASEKDVLDNYLDQAIHTQTVAPRNDSTTLADTEQKKAERYLAELPVSEDASNKALREKLLRVATGKEPWSGELGAEVVRLRDLDRNAKLDEEVKKDRRALQIAHAALEKLGYQVEPIQETMYVDGGEMFFRSASWDTGYYVRMKMQPTSNRMQFQMVRTGQDTTQNDEKMETRLCEALPALITTMEHQHLVIHPLGVKPPGSVEMAVISPGSVPQELKSKKREQPDRRPVATSQKKPRTMDQR